MATLAGADNWWRSRHRFSESRSFDRSHVDRHYSDSITRHTSRGQSTAVGH